MNATVIICGYCPTGIESWLIYFYMWAVKYSVGTVLYSYINSLVVLQNSITARKGFTPKMAGVSSQAVQLASVS